jgi:hypothetical protein
MKNNEIQQLKFSELLTVWKNFGLSQEWQSRSLPAVIVKEHGDAFTGTTQELIDVSIRCEGEGESYTPPPACKWCSLKTIDIDKHWTYGHRQGWWVCSQCKRVYPCRHECLDDVSEVNLTGTCSTCGIKLLGSFVADHLYKKYDAKAEHFRVNAASCRKQEQLRREHERFPMADPGHEHVTYVKSSMPSDDNWEK